MDKTNSRPQRDFSIFDSMDTESLREILRQDSFLAENEESDTDVILYIMGVIERRAAQFPGRDGSDVEAAWHTFTQHYAPDADGRSLYEDEEDGEAQPAPAFATQKKDKRKGYSQRKRRLLSVASTVALVIVIFFVGSVSAYAMGYDLWGAVVQWSAETFGFAYPDPEKPDAEPGLELGGLEFSSLQEALDTYEVKGAMVPTWLPEGYELLQIEVNESPRATLFYAAYQNREYLLSISIKEMYTESTRIFEKNDGPVTIYEAGGRAHYLAPNNARMTAIWINGVCECAVSGNVTEEEMKKIIDSIYE